MFLSENLRRVAPLVETLREVAAGHAATPAQVALAWTIRSDNVMAIPGASSVAQLESNAEAATTPFGQAASRGGTAATGHTYRRRVLASRSRRDSARVFRRVWRRRKRRKGVTGGHGRRPLDRS